MKAIALFALFSMFAPKDYPVQVRIGHMHIAIINDSRTRETVYVSGDGDLTVLDTDKPDQRYSFTFANCTRPEKERMMKARWRKTDQIIVLFPSSDGIGDECTLKLKPLH